MMPVPGQGAAFQDVQPDPSRVGGVANTPFVRLPDPAVLFRERAVRLRAVTEGNPLADYLGFLAGVVDVQQAAVPALPLPALPDTAVLAQRAEHGMPALSVSDLGAGAAAALAFILDHAVLDGAPPATLAARDAVSAMDGEERASLFASVFEGAYPVDRIGESLFAAAALQVHLSRLAACLDAESLRPVGDGVCPCCGGAPVGSVVVGWTQAAKARFLSCSLCGTLWNYVRIKCTSCASTQGVNYYTVEDGQKQVGVETCTSCQSYIKHLQQHEQPALDPVADDIATYGLDILAQDAGFRRAGLNPLFLIG